MMLRLPLFLVLLARYFAGTRKTLAAIFVTDQTRGCSFEGISYPYDRRLMNGKRLVAIACGAIENDEVVLADAHLRDTDIVVEFGSGLGIAAARMHRHIRPRRHICFEANPLAADYSRRLFDDNHLDIEIVNNGLADGTRLTFYQLDDYILSSFERPHKRKDYKAIEIATQSIDDIVSTYQPTAVFCDIEGAEKDFLPPDRLKTVNRVIIELHPGSYGHDGERAVISAFAKAGFAVAEKRADTYCFVRTSQPLS